MDEFPLDLLKAISLLMKGRDFLHFCQINRSIYNFCNTLPDPWWLAKFLRDYGPPSPRKPPYFTWRQFYLYKTNNMLRVMGVNNSKFRIWLHPNITYIQLILQLSLGVKSRFNPFIREIEIDYVSHQFLRITLDVNYIHSLKIGTIPPGDDVINHYVFSWVPVPSSIMPVPDLNDIVSIQDVQSINIRT